MVTPVSQDEVFNQEKLIPHEGKIASEIQAAIGTLIIAAASAEIALTYQIAACISNDDPIRNNVMPLISGQKISVKLGTLRTIFQTRFPEKTTALQAIERLQSCFDMRNLFAHGIPRTDLKTPPKHVKITELKMEGKNREWAKPKQISTKQILVAAREMVFRVRQIEGVLRSQGVAPSTSKSEIPASLEPATRLDQ